MGLRDRSGVSCIGRRILPLGPPGKPVSSLPGLSPFSLPYHVFSLWLPSPSLSSLSPSLLFLFLGHSSPSFPSPPPFSLCPPPHTLASSTPSPRPVALGLSAGTISCLPGLQSQLGQEQLGSRWVRLSRCPDISGQGLLTWHLSSEALHTLHKQSLRPTWGQVRENITAWAVWLSSL